jgi:low temperature requirement protein LtrA
VSVAQGAPDGHPPAPTPRRARRTATRVTTLELLFDLVFVLVVSQVARTVAVDPGWPAVGRAVLLMAVVWWMYDAYAWLTNQAVPDVPSVRLLLVAAMAAFLVLALAVPDAVHGDTAVLGWAYVAAAVVHGGLFIALGGPEGAHVMARVLPLNVAAGLLLGVAGQMPDGWAWLPAALPLLLFAVAATIARRAPFRLAGEHFAERHGLLMIIALGESVVSVGAAAGSHGLDGPTLVGAVLVVAVVASLWWCYFAGDDERAAHALDATPPHRRAGVALRAYYVDHLVMLVGLILLGAGLHLALEEPTHRPEAVVAGLVCGGVALFLVGDADYRRALRLGSSWWRIGAAGGALALAAVRPPSLVLLAAVAGVVTGAIVAEGWLARRRQVVVSDA